MTLSAIAESLCCRSRQILRENHGLRIYTVQHSTLGYHIARFSEIEGPPQADA